VSDEVLELGLEVRPDRALVRVAGELDLTSAPFLRGALMALAEHGGRIVVDLRELRFTDSSGIGALVSAWQAARQTEGGELLLAGPFQAGVHKVLEVAGITGTIKAADRKDLDEP
jgi:anti-sigma B factor antagonist